MGMKHGTWLLAAWLLTACQQAEPPLLEQLLRDQPGVVGQVMAQSERYALQIRYTQVDRDAAGQPHFTTHAFGVSDTAYFYPASTVKLPAVLLALEKLGQLGLDRETTLRIDSLSPRLTGVTTDSSSATGLPSVAHYARKILLVSDNDAYNRLYEFLGQAPLNAHLRAKGYGHTLLRHRLSIALSPAENRTTQALALLDATGREVFTQAVQVAPDPDTVAPPVWRGRGERLGDSVVWAPKDFGEKNVFPLRDQQRMLQALFFPEAMPAGLGFDLRESDRRFVMQYLSQWPRETAFPPYDEAHYYDGYVKFFLYGDTTARVTEDIRIFNKVGLAYGYLTDNAYIVDFAQGVEFFLAATLLVNENGVFNDDTYEYDTIGLPFLAELGRIILAYERDRPRTHPAPLEPLRLRYDR